MMTFWIIIALVMLVGITLIWLPHFKQKKRLKVAADDVRKQTNLALFNERINAFETELNEGRLDQNEFNALKSELEVNLLQDIKQAADDSSNQHLAPKSVIWPMIMSCCLLGISSYFYQHLGASDYIAIAHEASQNTSMSMEEQLAQQITMLEMQVKTKPDNSPAWFTLGHLYISAGQYDQAVSVFDNLISQAGAHAELIGPKATALYYQAGQQMTPEIQTLIDQALTLDSTDPSTLLLVGMNAFFTEQYQTAINAWQQILDSQRDDIDREALLNGVNSAKERLQMQLVDTTKLEKTSLNIAITIAPELANLAKPEDTIFVFARTIGSSKMPLAATQISAKNLPTTVMLNDSLGIGSDSKLSDHSHVEIIAVLSKQGKLSLEPGDIKGTIANAALNKAATLILDTQIQ